MPRAAALASLALAALTGTARADVPLETAAARPQVAPDVEPAPTPGGGFTPLLLLQTRATRSSVVTTNPFLDGQVVGQLGGANGTTTSLDERTMVVEQRAAGFLTWAPTVLDGQAAVTAAFEIDFGWGDQSYNTGGNKGGGFGGDQVNLQTRRLYGTFRPRLGPDHDLAVVAGLQFLSDGAHDPHVAGPDALFRTGGGLMLWGSEAAGLSAFGVHRTGFGEVLRYRLGTYSLVENGSGLADDVSLHMADVQLSPATGLEVGLHGWYLRDDSGGEGGLLGVGPTSTLSALQGGPSLSFPTPAGDPAEVKADLTWLGVDGGWNRDLSVGPAGARAFWFLNLGRLYITDQPDVDVRGWLTGAEARWRYAQGAGSELSVQAVASSRDGDGRDTYTGLVTGNSYGIVGAVWATHGTLLLFPDGDAINRQIAVVSDVSNGGRGLLAATAHLGFDPVPDRLTVSGNAALARTPDGEALGQELNLGVDVTPLPLLEVGLRGAVVTDARVPDISVTEAPTGDLTELPANPWALVAHLQWLAF